MVVILAIGSLTPPLAIVIFPVVLVSEAPYFKKKKI
jgi:TRAP-type C4-dicarboxylate transport system permease large subunit